jgi:hypothetical protein
MRNCALLVLLLLASSCKSMMDKGGFSIGGSSEIAAAEMGALESQTRARLSVLERGLNEYIQAKGEVPDKLDVLIPDYVAEVPETLTGIKECRDSAHVFYYKPEVIIDGVIDGSKLRGAGGWGYVFNDERVIIFVDCTRKSKNGTLWYNVRGVY